MFWGATLGNTRNHEDALENNKETLKTLGNTREHLEKIGNGHKEGWIQISVKVFPYTSLELFPENMF